MASGRRTRLWSNIAMLAVAFVLGAGARELLFVIDFTPEAEIQIQPATVRIQSANQIEITREALIRYLFDAPALPGELPETEGDGTYAVRMGLGFESLVRLIRAGTPNDRLVIYHAGHAPYGELDSRVVETLAARGYDVIVLEMPLVGVNSEPLTVELPNGPVAISRHDHMAYLDAMTPGSPIRYFIEPVIAMLNEYAATYDDITMIGVSGGGWTTTLATAIDTRIDRSYPVAGTLPLAVHFAREDAWGDWEQTEPSIYAIADYVDLYVLGAHERRQMQVLNQFDPCCFSGDHRAIYEPQVQAAIEASGGGSFDVFLDSDNRQHSLAPRALDAILQDMEIITQQ
jgi:hypothetical protein